MKIFFDFDDCLFDTKAFLNGLQDIFEVSGVPQELFRESYGEIRNGFLVSGLCYSIEAHIEKLRPRSSFDKNVLYKNMETYLTDTSKFLFPDVKNFFALMKKSGYQMFILSFGNERFQSAKIAGTGITLYIEKSIITDTDKAAALQKEIDADDKNIWFFDDRVYFIENVKQAFPNVGTVCVRRKQGRYDEEPNKLCDFVVKDLNEAKNIVSENTTF